MKGFLTPQINTRELANWAQTELSKLPQYVPLTKHYFADGMYCREVFRHAGVILVGKVHKKEHFYIVASGCVKMTTDTGIEVVRAPRVMVSKPGTKRIVASLEDSVCITVHRTDKTDIEEIEAELVEEDPSSMYGPGNIPKFLEDKT